MNTDSNPNNCQYSQALLDFIDASPTPFHAVDGLKSLLLGNGYRELNEEEAWSVTPGDKCFVTRNDSSLVVFEAGGEAPHVSGFKIIGAHTDSPNLRLKPNPVYEKNGYIQFGVEVYGGVLLGTWTDRDLSLAGRVLVKSDGNVTESVLVKSDHPLARVPQLAIHLNRKVNDKGLILNQQTHMPPIVSMVDELISSESVLKQWVAGEIKRPVDDIAGLELMLHDVQKSAFAGMNDEFLFAPRLDNLASCHAATLSLLESETPEAATRVLAFYDHEEIGSQTAQGGGSPFLKDILERLGGSREQFMRAVARSFFISADMAHAVHPNYSEMHDSRHMPLINQGPVIKINSNQRYATDGWSGSRFELLCERAGVKVQKFVVRSDLGCGSTIGPITAANLGIKTVDVGNPMLSMHSIREMAGSQDHGKMIRVFREFFSPDTHI